MINLVITYVTSCRKGVDMLENLTQNTVQNQNNIFFIPDNKNNNALYLKAYRKLRELIIQGYFQTGEKLMSEAELAGRMGIGRTSLRTALVLLCEDGYIKTFQGKGTYIVYDPHNNIQEYPQKYLLPFDRLTSYYKSSKNKEISYINIGQFANDFDSFLDETLQAQGNSINLFMRNYTVNGNVAIVSNVYYKAELFPSVNFKEFDKTETFLKDIFDNQLCFVDCSITPALDSLSRQISGFDDTNDNFILASSIWYDRTNRPIVFTKDHYNGNYISFKTRFYNEQKY